MSRLTAQEATIQSATVEIKILTVGGKQMTLSVFRQIPIESLIAWDNVDEKPSLMGQPWGRVNYHVGCEKPDDSWDRHVHVIWQSGCELRHAIEYIKEADEWGDVREEFVKLFHQLMDMDQLFIAV